MKIQTKITLLFFAIAASGLLLLNAAIFYFVSQFSFGDFFERLDARVKLTAQINSEQKNSAAFQEVRNRYLAKLDEETEYLARIDSSGKFVKPLPLPNRFYTEILTAGKARYSRDNRFYAGGVFTMPSGRYLVIVSAADPYGFKELAQLKRVLIVGLVVSLILTFLAGYIFSYYLVRPIRGIIKSVKSISATNLNSRLDDVSGKDEIAELVHTFNNMLTRLETAFETQNNFVSNASHELRTPLAIITSETELLLAGHTLPDAAARSGKTILAEAEKLEHILKSLIALAQSGFDGKKQNWQVIRVDELVMDVIESAKTIDPESVILPDLSSLPEQEELLQTQGNPNLLHLALSNIVLNACKYSSNAPVAIRLFSENRRIVITVTDQGIGIPEGEQQHIFEPFFRASNTSSFEGYGIGLPLTLNIIRLHKGTIGIRSEEGVGTEIRILLPLTIF